MKYSLLRLILTFSLTCGWLAMSSQCMKYLLPLQVSRFDHNLSKIVEEPMFNPNGVGVVAVAGVCGFIASAVVAAIVCIIWAAAGELETMLIVPPKEPASDD